MYKIYFIYFVSTGAIAPIMNSMILQFFKILFHIIDTYTRLKDFFCKSIDMPVKKEYNKKVILLQICAISSVGRAGDS